MHAYIDLLCEDDLSKTLLVSRPAANALGRDSSSASELKLVETDRWTKTWLTSVGIKGLDI